SPKNAHGHRRLAPVGGGLTSQPPAPVHERSRDARPSRHSCAECGCATAVRRSVRAPPRAGRAPPSRSPSSPSTRPPRYSHRPPPVAPHSPSTPLPIPPPPTPPPPPPALAPAPRRKGVLPPIGHRPRREQRQGHRHVGVDCVRIDVAVDADPLVLRPQRIIEL